MATRTSVGTGLWSAAGTWDTGVPADNDVVVIAAGHTVEFDVDQSGFANGIDTITITGTLKLTRTTGTYYLKIKAAKYIRGTGVFDCGTSGDPIPFASKHTIAGGVGWYIEGGYSTGLTMTVFAAEPTIKYVLTSASEALGQTVIGVDTDVTGDIWQVGDTVRISNIEKAHSSEENVISDISATEITISVGLAAAKSQYASVALVSRNVKFLSNGGNFIYNFIKTGKTLTIGGGEFRGAVSYSCITSCIDLVVSGGVFSSATGITSTAAFNNCTRITLNGGVITGIFYGFYGCTTMVVNNAIALGLAYLATGGTGLTVNDIVFRGASYITGSCFGILVNGGTYYGLYQLLGGVTCVPVIRGGTFTYFNMLVQSGHYEIDGTNIVCSSIGWLAYYGATIKAKNLSMTGIAKQVGNTEMLNESFYSESIDHNKSIGNYKCWTKGGYGEVDAAVFPVGFINSVKITLNTTVAIDARAYYREKILVHAGKSVTIISHLRKPISMSYLPRTWVFEDGYEPFYDPTKIIHEFIMTDSIDTWESESYVYTNSTAYDKMLEIRAVGKNTTSYFNTVINTAFGGGLSRSRLLGGVG